MAREIFFSKRKFFEKIPDSKLTVFQLYWTVANFRSSSAFLIWMIVEFGINFHIIVWREDDLVRSSQEHFRFHHFRNSIKYSFTGRFGTWPFCTLDVYFLDVATVIRVVNYTQSQYVLRGVWPGEELTCYGCMQQPCQMIQPGLPFVCLAFGQSNQIWPKNCKTDVPFN